MLNRVLFWVYILFCFEVGLFLTVFPWMPLWDDNALLSYIPRVRPVVLSNYFRGAISGLGIVNLLLGALEVAYSQGIIRKPGLGSPDSVRDL